MYHGIAIAAPVAVPVAGGAKAEWLQLLAKFGFPPEVANGIITAIEAIGLVTFDDFRCYFSKNSDFSAELVLKAKMADGVTALPSPGLWASRLTQIWEAVFKAHADHQDILVKGTESADLDKMLDQKVLTDVHAVFWERYKIEFVSALTPGDSLVSRKKRELEAFAFTVVTL